jgi:transcriptional antiterminator NusG
MTMTERKAQWYVVQTMSGMENKVERTMRAKFRLPEYAGFENVIHDIKVPMEKISEVKEGKRREVMRKIFPGYILVQVSLFDENNNLDDRAWYFIRETEGVIGFASGGERPVALSDSEVADILAQTEKGEVPRPKIEFEVGEKVIIREGPFADFEATVEATDSDRGKLRLSVSIFGRSTPVEVEYWQVERSA